MSAALHIGPREAAAEILALTLWGEASDRPVRAIEALAALVMNRARRAAEPHGPAHWGRGVAGVCRAPFQFPCWNRNHPRHARLRDIPAGDAALAICRRIATRALAGTLPDPTGGGPPYPRPLGRPRWGPRRPAAAGLGGLWVYRPQDLT